VSQIKLPICRCWFNVVLERERGISRRERLALSVRQTHPPEPQVVRSGRMRSRNVGKNVLTWRSPFHLLCTPRQKTFVRTVGNCVANLVSGGRTPVWRVPVLQRKRKHRDKFTSSTFPEKLVRRRSCICHGRISQAAKRVGSWNHTSHVSGNAHATVPVSQGRHVHVRARDSKPKQSGS
jgi:hypothetical protein